MIELAYDIQHLNTCQPTAGCHQPCHGLRIPANRLTLITSPNNQHSSAMLGTLAGGQGQLCGQLFGQPLSRGQVAIAHLGAHATTSSRLRLGDFVMQARRRQHWLARPHAIDHEAVSHALHTLGISELAQHKLHTLNAAQRQLACLAQALAGHAPVLLLDEPASLQPPASRSTLLRKLAAQALRGRTLVCTLQDSQAGQLHAHWLIRLHADGHIEQGAPALLHSAALAA
jgi:ABC-type cobalamin/Fe3+-siderophores transport system ATPase subunit